jgi:hypothetical protein
MKQFRALMKEERLKNFQMIRAEALQEAAFSPAIFARIFERFENRFPSINELDEFLETQNIIKPTKKRIIKNYQKTFEFAVGQGNDFWLYQGTSTSIPFAEENSFGSLSPVLGGQQLSKRISETATGADDNTGDGSGQALTFPLVGNVIAKITFSHKIEGRHLESLVQYLQLHKSQNFPEKS